MLCLSFPIFETTGGSSVCPQSSGPTCLNSVSCAFFQSVLSKVYVDLCKLEFISLSILCMSFYDLTPPLSCTGYLYALILSSKDSTPLQLSLRAEGRGVTQARGGLVSRSSASGKNVRREEMKGEAGDRQEPNYEWFCQPW